MTKQRYKYHELNEKQKDSAQKVIKRMISFARQGFPESEEELLKQELDDCEFVIINEQNVLLAI